jgi:RecB family exonuclease
MRAAAPSIWNTNMAETKKDYGVKVHTALARIVYESDTEFAINSMFEEGLIDTEERDSLLITIPKIISKDQLKPYFQHGLIIKNEAEIINANGELFRPDRIVINGKMATIIDYKTGEQKKEHGQQVIGYADLLHEMGYTITEKLLVYIEKDQIVNV